MGAIVVGDRGRGWREKRSVAHGWTVCQKPCVEDEYPSIGLGSESLGIPKAYHVRQVERRTEAGAAALGVQWRCRLFGRQLTEARG